MNPQTPPLFNYPAITIQMNNQNSSKLSPNGEGDVDKEPDPKKQKISENQSQSQSPFPIPQEIQQKTTPEDTANLPGSLYQAKSYSCIVAKYYGDMPSSDEDELNAKTASSNYASPDYD